MLVDFVYRMELFIYVENISQFTALEDIRVSCTCHFFREAAEDVQGPSSQERGSHHVKEGL